MSITRLLWAFNIETGTDDQVLPNEPGSLQGRVVEPDIFAFTDGENTRPQPFPAKFTPRSDRIKDIILDEAESAREELRIYDGETRLRFEDFIVS
jgi:hypothetical protein